ncbi:MAG: TraB/GumN family protein [Saprospiraceae bacterium]|nr:TraB/GumN family protein [Saprospiraceae bacterium]
MGRSSNKQSLLWEVRRADKTLAGYLLGTMHTRDQRVHALLAPLVPYLSQCQVVATEFSIHEVGVTQESFLQHVPDWTSKLSKKQKKALIKMIEHHQLGTLDSYRQLPPLLLLQALVEELLGKESAQPFDLVLAQQAESDGLSVTGVETLQEQLDILQTIPLDVQVKQLTQVLANQKKYKRQIRKQVKWYLQQNIRQLYKASRKQMGRLRKLLLLDRNKRMAKRMAAMYAQQVHFIAIGAAHLSGNKGVLAGLKKRGYRLQPITFKTHD